MKRFDPVVTPHGLCDNCVATMEECPDGEYMLFEDMKFRDVWIVWSNTDLTEGRGREYPKHICESWETACRLSRGGYVQGSNCPIYKGKAIEYNCVTYVPGFIEYETDEDRKNRTAREKLESAIVRAKALGLSEEDIEILRKSAPVS